MIEFELSPTASQRVDEIYEYSFSQWGEAQADAYIDGLVDHFKRLCSKQAVWRKLPARYDIDGYFSRYEKHFVYFKIMKSGNLGVLSILHQSMNLEQRLQEDFLTSGLSDE